MKKIMIMLALATNSIGISAQEIANTLVFEMKDGSKVAYTFDERPSIRFSGDNMIVATNMYESTLLQKNIQRYSFDWNDINGISAPSIDGLHIAGDMVYISQIKAGTPVMIYTLGGRLLHKKESKADGTVSFSLAGFPDGIYFVKYNDHSVKISKS